MKIYLFHILSICFFSAQAQQIHLQGTIIDKEKNLPIVGATISIQAKKIYFLADNDGRFDIYNDKINNADTVRFSCVGYQERKIAVINLDLKGNIDLTPVVNMLRQVNIHLPVLIKTGSKEKTTKDVIATSTNSDRAAFMEGSKGVKGSIQTVGFFLTSGIVRGGDVTAPFRIRIFDIAPDGTPGHELTKGIIIASAKKDKAWFDVDISTYKIQNPDSGFFVAFSILSIENYKLKPGAQTTDNYGNKWETIDTAGIRHNLGVKDPSDILVPWLGVTALHAKQSRIYYTCTTLQNMSWHWEPYHYIRGYLIRAEISPE